MCRLCVFCGCRCGSPGLARLKLPHTNLSGFTLVTQMVCGATWEWGVHEPDVQRAQRSEGSHVSTDEHVRLERLPWGHVGGPRRQAPTRWPALARPARILPLSVKWVLTTVPLWPPHPRASGPLLCVRAGDGRRRELLALAKGKGRERTCGRPVGAGNVLQHTATTEMEAHKDLSSARNPSEQERDSPLQDLEDSSLELEQGLQEEDNLLTPPSAPPETWLGLPIYRARRQCIWEV